MSNCRVLDPEWDDAKQSRQIDTWVAQGYDGIVVWVRVAAPSGPPIERAVAKGIPVVNVDRMVGTDKVTCSIEGNNPANGAQQGMYLIHKLLQETGKVEGNIVMIRKPLGSSADAGRTGHFLKIVSYFPDLKIIANHHNNSARPESFRQVQDTMMAHSDIDVIFCTGGEQSMGAIQAVDQAKRWNSRKDGRKIIILSNDDSRECLNAVKIGKQDMLGPMTPLLGGIGVRVLLRLISGEELPQKIPMPEQIMVTKEKENVFGLTTLTVSEWLPYAYGPSIE